MRLGLRPTVFEEGTESWSQARKLYGGANKIWERHRHRYEVNPEYVDQLTNSGLIFSGKDEKGERMQILELRGTCCVCLNFDDLCEPFHQNILSSWACKLILSFVRAHSTRHPPSLALSPHQQALQCLLNSSSTND